MKWEFEIRDQQGFDVEVKKCGYRCVSEKDLQASKLTMMHTEYSVSWKHKFLQLKITSSNCNSSTLPS